jgi:hypothetical protein
VFGECAVIAPDEYYRLRTAVSQEFSLHTNDVLVVGSGKLGFSIAPTKQFRLFGETSDLDVVIVSDRLFDLIWKDVYQYSAQGGYWENFGDFRKYMFQGWIRPDKLPPDHKFSFGKQWWEFFNRLSASRGFSVPRIRGAVYKNFFFLESYQTQAVRLCAATLSNEN